MMREIRTCMAADVFDDPASEALFAEYAEECANPVLGRTVPSRAMYEAIEAAGAGKCLSVSVDGALVGFAFVLIGPLPHFQGLFATVESVFLNRQSRRFGLGLRLMEAVESLARDAGCEAIFFCAPTGSRFLAVLRRRRGYWRTNVVFTKRLQWTI